MTTTDVDHEDAFEGVAPDELDVDEPEVDDAADDDFDGKVSWPDLELEPDGMPAPDVLREAMKAVIDPEIGYNVVDLGLVYGIDKPEPGLVHIDMTLTAMGCPLTELIHQQATMVLCALPGVNDVDVSFTFDPPWSPEMIDEDVREELRAMGMPV